MKRDRLLSNRLTRKLALSFFLILLLVGAAYVLITFSFTSRYFDETTQKLNANVANHLIEEKFQNASPFLEDGSINKPLFGDIMHDMMAVNRGIEVYLTDLEGQVRYSVVLDHTGNEPAASIDTAPIQEFIATGGEQYILGDDPTNPDIKKIFSAAAFEVDGNTGYIYIILKGQQAEAINSSLLGSYFLRLGLGASLLTVLFAAVIGLIAVWYLTKNLREIIFTAQRFRDGDLKARVVQPEEMDLSQLSLTFNSMADRIEKSIEELQSVESLRKELIANVSHDLRTPLAIMQGYVETLQIKKDELDEVQRERFLIIIQNSIQKLNRLIQQLFEYSKLEAKQIVPVKEPFAITDLAHDVHENYTEMAQRKEIKLDLQFDEDLPLVYADIGLVERVIQNLMDNALKFTPRGGTVTIKLTPVDNAVKLSIQDTGPGIPKNELTHIYERFKQVSPEQKGRGGGAGLGLAIAKKIMEIHDATLRVISQPQEGTEFYFELPYSNG
ncbi:MAG: ATP-binding protein [Leeuwenhoekiella sp.]